MALYVALLLPPPLPSYRLKSDAESEADNGDADMSAPGAYTWATGRCDGGGWRLSWGAGGAWSGEAIDDEVACAREEEEQELWLRPLRCPTGMKCQL